MTLFEECMIALGKNSLIVENSKKQEILNEVFMKFPFEKWGRVDWKKTKCVLEILYDNQIKEKIEGEISNIKCDVYIIWDEVTLPVVRTKLENALNVIDDVSAVGSNTWIYAISENKIVEIFHDGIIKIGVGN